MPVESLGKKNGREKQEAGQRVGAGNARNKEKRGEKNKQNGVIKKRKS